MFSPSLPLELLNEVFEYIKEDYNYKTLYSCILVNRQWHNFNIPALWRNPFNCRSSINVLINCLLINDKNFLVKDDDILLKYILLGRPPLHNYAKYATELDLSLLFGVYRLSIPGKDYHLKKSLVNFILDHSTTIKKLKIVKLEFEWITYHCRFDSCFQNLSELICDLSLNSKILDKLSKICKNIQNLKMHLRIFSQYDDDVDRSMVKLVKAQKQIKKLSITSKKRLNLSDSLKKAISIHSQSIINYESCGKTNDLDTLIPTFKNLKILNLTCKRNKMPTKKSIILPCIEGMKLSISASKFIKDNGVNLRRLYIIGDHPVQHLLKEMIRTVAQKCRNLEHLTIVYKNEVYQQLVHIFNNCTKLKSIGFYNRARNYTINGDKILEILNQTSPKNLNSIIFESSATISDNSLGVLMRNWEGPRPIEIETLGKRKQIFY